MLNEWDEFEAYTGKVEYTATGKSDTGYLGRFTFDTILDFEGMARILTILARGYLFHEKDGTIKRGAPREQIEAARRALCAWCSIPDSKKAIPKEEWQFQTDFSDLHDEFPGLVEKNGGGWFYRHVHAVADFMLKNPDKVRKTSLDKAEIIQKKFDAAWRNKVLQYQVPIFSPQTKGAWTLRFDDVIADALEIGPLRRMEAKFSPELIASIKVITPKEVPTDVICTLIAYYAANKPEDSDWVVLPVANFDVYFGDTKFGRKYLSKIPKEIIERTDPSFGVSRYRVAAEYLLPCEALSGR
ncbi:MAG: hypothetical protein ACOX7I_00765 [Oscillospiraceae bacterium]|jgi:hypothetical protein